jgi:hypothetical protein
MWQIKIFIESLRLKQVSKKKVNLKNTRIIISVLIAFLFCLSAKAIDKTATDSVFRQDEKRISQLASQLIEVRFDDTKVAQLNEQLIKEFEQVLKKEDSFKYPFDSIHSLGKVVSDDGLVRIFTWYAIRADGSHMHSGFIQYFNKSENLVLLYPLIDKSDEMTDVETATFSNENWFGATYYEIIDSKSSFGQLYVLLGWDGNNIYSNKKVVESLFFTESGRPKFGKTVFVFGKIKTKRIIFEYSRMATMLLKYDSKLKMIVMDHLAPSKPIYQGQSQYYGPDLSYDALKFEDDFWVYSPDFDYKPAPEKNRRRR